MEKEAASLPAAVPETEGLTALIQKAQEWKARSAALAAQKAPLKKMREVLHMGLRMPVEVPQVESLRAEIRRREWEETAKKVGPAAAAAALQLLLHVWNAMRSILLALLFVKGMTFDNLVNICITGRYSMTQWSVAISPSVSQVKQVIRPQ